MTQSEKLKINIYPPQIEILKNNGDIMIIKIEDNITNESKPENMYNNIISANGNLNDILLKYKSDIINSLTKLISCSTTNPNTEFHLEKTFLCHDLPISKIYFNHQGNQILTCSYDGNAILWDRKQGNQIYTIKDHANTINSAVFTKDDNLLLTGSFDNLAMLFSTTDGKRLKTFEGHDGEIVEVNINKEEKIFCTASMDTTSKIFDLENATTILTLSGHDDVVFKASFNDTSKNVLTGSYDKTCKLFDAKNGDVIFTFDEHTAEISNCFFSPKDNNIIISTSFDGTSKVYDIRKENKTLKTFDDHSNRQIICADITNNGKYLATGGEDNTINVYNLENLEKIYKLNGHDFMGKICTF